MVVSARRELMGLALLFLFFVWCACSGFDREDEWGFRALEPSRCCISSIALVLLKTGIQHHPNGEKPVEVDYPQMATAQKLLLFWRKPAVCVGRCTITIHFTDDTIRGNAGGMV